MDEVITASDASSSFGSTTSQSSIIPSNLPLLSAFLSFALAQFLKLFTTWYKEKRWDSRRMLGSGGMPSSHSATVTALAVAIGLKEGTGGPAFALAVVLACVVMYDATGVRLHAGRQAELLNQIVCELPPEHPVSNVRPLRDSLGHTPLQLHYYSLHCGRGCNVGMFSSISYEEFELANGKVNGRSFNLIVDDSQAPETEKHF
ncbi:hypothetical protein FNV43_RR03847 [Rhamnella rubrinervis]|uniref:Acid phosphatase/vanadium-dependent haloperoxidase-related protein n=1 Tax=Rhamnella rubrinervis TaxID=2594499 RepID=A0A8K0HIG9_9ROSA|nr:hypothetical protein FNV43_RR03847 [Rhamnella rubrinervis]